MSVVGGEGPTALEQAAVHQDAPADNLDQVTGARDLLVGAAERNLLVKSRRGSLP